MGRPDLSEDIEQANLVAQNLTLLGHQQRRESLAFDLEKIKQLSQSGECVFNLMEGFAGHGRLIHVVTECLETWGIPYTGNSAEALRVCGNKLVCRAMLHAAKVPMPQSIFDYDRPSADGGAQVELVIRKSRWEHGSIGVKILSWSELMQAKAAGLLEKDEFLYEEFIDGDEYSISVMGTTNEPVIIGVMRVNFGGPSMPQHRVLTYASKWDATSFDYRRIATVPFQKSHEPILYERLEGLASDAWRVLGLAGYARIDVRCSKLRGLYVIDVNPNPSLAPDSGFIRTLTNSNISLHEFFSALTNEC